MKLAIACGIILFFQVTAPVTDSVPAAIIDTSVTNNDTLIKKQLQIMSEQKKAPLTLTDTIKAVAGRYAFTIDRGRRDLKKHNEAAETLIQELDSIIQEINEK